MLSPAGLRPWSLAMTLITFIFIRGAHEEVARAKNQLDIRLIEVKDLLLERVQYKFWVCQVYNPEIMELLEKEKIQS